MVDIGSTPYTTRARLYPDSDQEFEIEWYEARPDAPLLGFPSALNCLEWEGDREDWLETSVGEIFGAPVVRHYRHVNLLALGQHQCGTAEDFAGNGTFDPLPPFVDLRDDGLPFCCGALFESGGGLVLGGTADVVWRGPYTGTGGLVVGGTVAQFYAPRPVGGLVVGGSADVQYSGEMISSGGLVLGGTDDVLYLTWEEGSGGLVVGGSADEQYNDAEVGSGGLVVGGSADEQYTLPAAGGLVLGGSATEVATTWWTGTGGLVLGGSATIYAGTIYTGSGGLVLGGSADEVYVTEQSGSGGLVVGGSATQTYTPPVVTPGTTCGTAGVCALGTTYGATVSGGLTQNWWVIPGLTAGAAYNVVTTNVGISGANMTLWSGGSCPSPTPQGFSNPHANCYNLTANANGNLWLTFSAFSSTAYTFKVTTGSC